jgi:hypothetical protein
LRLKILIFYVPVYAMAQLVKHPYKLCEFMSSNPAGNVYFFQSVMKLPSLVLAARILLKTIKIWIIGTYFL